MIAVLIISMHIVISILGAMTFEWIWTQEVIKTRTKRETCQIYWMLLCLASYIVTAGAAIFLVPVMMAVGYTHVDILRIEPTTRITPDMLVRHIPKVIRHTLQRISKP